MPTFPTLDDLDVRGRRVLVRADLNVPVHDRRITDTSRIDSAARTVLELANRGARVIVLSHFGRPKGRPDPAFSLALVAPALSKALGGRPVAFSPDCIGERARAVVDGLGDGAVALMENVRFHPGEETNDEEFAENLASLADLYVNDAFSAAHRSHASTVALARLLPSAAGRNMATELETLASALDKPERPVAAVVGGAKISTKLDVLGNLIPKVDILVIGGAMANTLLHARGTAVGKSLCESGFAEAARRVGEVAAAAGCELVLPIDAIVAREFREGAPSEAVSVDAVPDDAMILDVGPKTVAGIIARLESCKTIVWNGPLGAFEVPPFDAATNAVARAVAALCGAGKVLAVAGGGDTVSALRHAGAAEGFSYLSTAGGAFLEWLEGKQLPGVAALERLSAVLGRRSAP